MFEMYRNCTKYWKSAYLKGFYLFFAYEVLHELSFNEYKKLVPEQMSPDL